MDENLYPVRPAPRARPAPHGGQLPIPPAILPMEPVVEPAPQPRDHYAALERCAKAFGVVIKSLTGYWEYAVGAKAAKGRVSHVAMAQLRRKLHEADTAWCAMRQTLVAMIDSLEDAE